jgi:hypothetical protein
MNSRNKTRNVALFLAGGVLLALFWIAVLNGFWAGTLVTMSLIVGALGAVLASVADE